MQYQQEKDKPSKDHNKKIYKIVSKTSYMSNDLKMSRN